MAKYVKKPIVIDAIEWAGTNMKQLREFMGKTSYMFTPSEIKIKTLEGEMIASKGDFIIKGVEGEFYPCKPSIFHKTYTLKSEGE